MASYGPNLQVGDVVQIRSICRTTDQIGMNVFHYKVAETSGLVSLGTTVEALLNLGFPAALVACISSAAEYRGMMVSRIFPTLSIEFPEPTGAGPGTVAGDLLPRQVAGLVKKRSAEAGQRKGGRFYIPFPGEGDNSATSIPTAGYLARLDALRAILVQSLTAGTLTANAVIVHRATAAPNPVTPFETRTIQTMQSVPAWATQRRRGSFGRTNTSPL